MSRGHGVGRIVPKTFEFSLFVTRKFVKGKTRVFLCRESKRMARI